MTAPTGWHPGEPLPDNPVTPPLSDFLGQALHGLLPILMIFALVMLLPLVMRLLLLGMTTPPARPEVTGPAEEEAPLFTAQQVMDTLPADVRAAIEEGPRD